MYRSSWVVFSHDHHGGGADHLLLDLWTGLFSIWRMYRSSTHPVVSVDASGLFLTDMNQDGALTSLEESAQKMLAETVCFHVEDFGKAGSLLQSLKQRGKKWCQNLFFDKHKRLFPLNIFAALCHPCAFLFSPINSKHLQRLVYDRRL